MIKKINKIVSGIILGSFVITLLTFAYRYMWFTIETIPPDRWVVALIGIMVAGCWFAFSFIEG